MEEYREVTRRFTLERGEIEDIFVPAKASLPYLAKKVSKKRCENQRKCEDILFSRIFTFVEEPFLLANLQDKKPTEEEKSQASKRLGTLKDLVQENLQGIIKEIFGSQIHDPRYKCTGKSQERNEYNQLIFMYHLQTILGEIATSSGIEQVCQDIELVKEIKEDSSRFKELERLGSRALSRFMSLQRIRYIPKEDQYQEGLLAIWSAAQVYRGKNFARFNTLAQKSLDYKFLNLLRFYTSYKRKVHKFTKPMGSATDSKDSFIAKLVDMISSDAWERSQRAQMSDQQDPSIRYDPFMQPSIDYEGDNNTLNDTEAVFQEHYRTMQTELVDHRNFPHMNERTVTYAKWGEILGNKKSQASREFLQKMSEGDVYVDEKGTMRTLHPTPIMQELERLGV